MNSPADLSALRFWPEDDATQTPYAVYTDPAIYKREQERIFRGPTWSFVALEAEIPNVYDFKSTYIGDTPVVVTRTEDGFAAWVNRCAHRGAVVCREMRGNAQTHTCVYHQWAYDVKGKLQGVPFIRGTPAMAGMPKDFNKEEYGLPPLRVESYKGLLFASFSKTVESLYDYLGEAMRPGLDRVFNRPLKFLGCTRQYSSSNWKLYIDNVRDPYHASLLHLFHTTFGIYRSTMGGGTTISENGLHSWLQAFKIENEDKSAYEKGNMRTYQQQVKLADPAILETKKEYDKELTNHIQSIFPSLVVQQIYNSLVVRHLLPKGPNNFELTFNFFGYADDDEEMTARRMLQANLVGPAGFISMEDTEATELVQRAIPGGEQEFSTMKMGGSGTSSEASLITEAAARALWHAYRRYMEI